MIFYCHKIILGNQFIGPYASGTGNQGYYAKLIAGVGNPFYACAAIPPAPVGKKLIGLNLSEMPNCTDNYTTNLALIAAMAEVDPYTVLLYEDI